MRRLEILGMAALMFAAWGYAAPQGGDDDDAHKMDGEWELVGFKYGAAPARNMASNRREIKLITGTHFVWVVYDVKSRKPVSMGGGRCFRRGNQYTEQIEFGDIRTKGMTGKPQIFEILTDGKRWQHSGVLSDGLRIDEIWQRVE